MNLFVLFPFLARFWIIYPSNLCARSEKLEMLELFMHPHILPLSISRILCRAFFCVSHPMSYNDLHKAACKGNVRAVEELIQRKGIDLDARGPKGDTALYLSSANGHLKVVQLLDEAGADKVIPLNFSHFVFIYL